MKVLIKRALNAWGYDLRKLPPPKSPAPPPAIPDGRFYAPLFSPWLGYGQFQQIWDDIKAYTLISPDRAYVLHTLATQALDLGADIWECGVYKGGTARLLAKLVDAQPAATARLHLFDTFEGMPETDPEHDLHGKGDFADTDLASVQRAVGSSQRVDYHQGFIPDTFRGLEDARIAFAHIDVDIYKSVWDCCEFILPRLVPGGIMVFDDYGFPTCPGAREAVDAFFHDRPLRPLVLSTGQAIIFNAA